MKIVVVGCGSIGRRHMKNLLSIGHQVIGVDISEEYRKWVEENIKIITYDDFSKALGSEKPSVCWVCTPPSSHISIAKTALDNGLHVFIEKPISSNLDGLKDIIKLARKKKLKLTVGYNLRFSKGIITLKKILDSGTIGKPLSSRIIVAQYLPDWRPWQNYRDSYTAKKSLGGGIILDASHELDYARWLFGEAKYVTCVANKISSLEVETEDNAEIIIEFSTGAIANLHLDFVRRDQKRGCEIVGEKGSVELIFGNQISIFNAERKEKQIIDIGEDHNETYVRESKDFLDAIAGGKEPFVSAEDGAKTLLLALLAKESAEKKKTLEVKKNVF